MAPAIHRPERRSDTTTLSDIIPFMKMLSAEFPEAQFVVTGVLGPESNAHGPNEFLHAPFAKRLTCCIAALIAEMRCEP